MSAKVRWWKRPLSPKAQGLFVTLFFGVVGGLYLVGPDPQEAQALPSYARLYHAKYGYKISCNICHQTGGGSAITDYGRDFKRFGLSFPAFGKIEKRDSDGDGIANLEEILAKANPGDPRSTPQSPGDWLERIEESFIPKEQLVQLFPEASYYTVLEGTLNDQQVAAIEAALGRPLEPEDKVPTFYFAFSGTKEQPQRIGLAIFGTPKGLEGPMMLGIGISLKGQVAKTVIYRSEKDKGTFTEAFLEQFQGKILRDAFRAGEDFMPIPEQPAISQDVANSVKLALLTMYRVFAKRE